MRNPWVYTETIRLLVSLQREWEKVQEQLPRQLTHGDYGEGNLLFWHEQPVAILDFDFLRVRERVFELAYTLYWWLWHQGHGQIEDISSWQRAKDLLTAYNEATPRALTAQEIQALPLVMASVPLYWIAETLFLPNPGEEVIKQAKKLPDACWIFEHRKQLADQLA